MKPPAWRPFAKEDFAEAPWMERLLRPLNQVLGQLQAGVSRGLTFGENLNAEVKTLDVGGGSASTAVAASDTHAYATVDVTTGAPGSVALVGSGSGLSGVSIVTNATTSLRAVRFTFATAMPDTNYVALATREYPHGYVARQMFVFTRATTSFEIGWGATHAEAWEHVDSNTHRFSAMAYRHAAATGAGETSAFPVKFQTTVRGKALGILVLRAVSLNGRDETPVSGIGGAAWGQDGATISLRGVTGLSAGTTYRLTLLVVGG